MAFLAGLTEASIEAARVYPGERAGGEAEAPGNSLGRVLIRPGGRACYPAVWTQDFSMTLATGFVTPKEALDHLRLIARTQNGPAERRLASGAVVPPFAVPDHILFNGEPVYFPGTYSSGGDQGGEPWGLRPPVNNHFDFILIAHHVWSESGGGAFLCESVGGMPLIERLRAAFRAPEIDGATGLVRTAAERRAVGFIFCDSIYMTGHLLFASMLRWRAARQLADLERALGHEAEARALEAEAARMPPHFPRVFGDPERIGGWLAAATEVGRQPDVWGTIFALYSGILSGEPARAAMETVVRALEEGTILHEGAVRHVPADADASPASAWERTPTARNRYQNGAYWHTPTGWLIAVLAGPHPQWAARIFDAMIGHLRREDFRRGDGFGAPWECFGPEPEAAQNPVFLAAVALPYGVLRKL